MADTAEESPAQRSARIRREKREKKVTEGGSDRLARITNASGRQQDLQPAPPPKPTVADDPGDVDIPHIPSVLTNSYNDGTSPPGPSAEDAARLRAALRSQQPLDQQQQQGPPGTGADDPMVKMMQQMQQMLGLPSSPGADGMPGGGAAAAGGPGSASAGAGGPELPPALASLLSGQPMSQGQQQAEAPSTSGYVWRIVHALFALGLGLYIVLRMPFTGSKADRLSPVEPSGAQSVFWIFATAELGLQSTRYLLERGKPPQGGMILTVSGYLPEPYKGYLQLLARYSSIYTTLVEDAMMVVFMLGTVVWWRGDL